MSSTSTKARFKLLIVGVGGQGVLTASKFLGEAAFSAGLPVSVGQLHGMAQRGGSVECSVLIGPGKSSFIRESGADAVIGLEPLEVVRSLSKLSKQTKAVINLGQVVPFSLAIKEEAYPPLDGVLERIRAVAPAMYQVDGPRIVKEVGVSRTLNVVMLGALSALEILPFESTRLWAAIEKKSPAHFIEVNRQAYDLGRRAVLDG